MIVTLALHTYEDTKDEYAEYDLTDDGERVMRDSVKKTEEGEEEGIDNRTEDEMAADDDDVGNVRQMLRDIQVKSK